MVVSAATASTSFTTDVTGQNFDNGAFQVIWTSYVGASASVRLQASIDGSNFSNLTVNPTTLSTGSSSILYNITDAGYPVYRVLYDAGTTTAGTLDVWVSRKSRR